ncbi:MAG TPA: hypothetical protein VGJ29_02095 [Vicinamibacterales bacterium]
MRWWWTRGGRSELVSRRAPPSIVAGGADAQVGEYQLLYKYLHDRYANRVVLTFAEIEDLLGFALPGAARFHHEWWGGVDALASQSPQADSWTLASRTATVNLSAQVVVFDRRNGLLPSTI